MVTTKKKPTQAVKSASKNVPATVKSKLPANIADFDNQEGFENVGARDVVMPRIALLQDLSPQLKKNKPEFIKGAEAGMFCNTAAGIILPNPLPIIPCFYAMVYLEWAPRASGKGLIRNYGTDGSIMDQTERGTTDKDKFKNFLKNGNLIVETATYFVLYQDEEGDWNQGFLPLASTQLKNSKRWMTKLKAEKVARPDGSKFNPAIYYRAWNAVPTQETNNEGDWFGWGFEPADTILEIDPSKELLAVAKEFCRQAKVGLVRGDVEGATHEQQEQDGAM